MSDISKHLFAVKQSLLHDIEAEVGSISRLVCDSADMTQVDYDRRDIHTHDKIDDVKMMENDGVKKEGVKKEGGGVEMERLKKHLWGRVLSMRRENNEVREKIEVMQKKNDERKRNLKIACETYKSSEDKYGVVLKQYKLQEKELLIQYIQDQRKGLNYSFSQRINLGRLYNQDETSKDGSITDNSRSLTGNNTSPSTFKSIKKNKRSDS